MLTKKVTYETLNGETVTDTLYFHLDENEVVEYEASFGKGGVEGTIKRIMEAEDGAAMLREYKNLILMCYGVKSEDGKKFIKTKEMRDEFDGSLAYNEVFMDLAKSDQHVTDFIKNVLPRKMAAAIAKAENETPTPPPSLAAPTPPSV